MKFRPNDLNDPATVLQHEDQINQILLEDPQNPDIYVVKSVLELHKGNSYKALTYINKAIGFTPDRAGYYTTLSTILGNLGLIKESGDALRRGYKLSQTVPALNWNYALWLLQNGEHYSGWDLYRWRKVHLPGHRRLLEPEWEGQQGDYKNKTLMVWTEQGFGDQIMFFRFLAQVKKTFGFGKVIFECPSELYTLFERNTHNVDCVYVQSNDFHCPYPFDYHCSLADLPFILKIDNESDFNGELSYLTPEQDIVNVWNEGFNQVEGKKIGICWKGSAGHVNDKNRSTTIETFAPLAKHGKLIALVKDGGDEIPEGLELLSVRDGLHSADYTAAVISKVDFVVTVDTFIAHLAGAMGKKTYLMLPYIHEWRWGLNGNGKSYLYNSVQMYRQETPGDYTSVMERIMEDIENGTHSLANNS